jgi:hypothetical protein
LLEGFQQLPAAHYLEISIDDQSSLDRNNAAAHHRRD